MSYEMIRHYVIEMLLDRGEPMEKTKIGIIYDHSLHEVHLTYDFKTIEHVFTVDFNPFRDILSRLSRDFDVRYMKRAEGKDYYTLTPKKTLIEKIRKGKLLFI